MKILFIANIFPPVIGGSAVVYENLCRQLKEEVAFVAPWRSYVTGEPIPGWKETDTRQPFPISRVELLRPLMRSAPLPILGSLWRQLTEDVPLRRTIRRRMSRIVQGIRPTVVCIGELQALSWLSIDLKARGLPVVQFIHGEEITTFCASRQLRKEAERSLRNADALIAVSSFTRARLIDLGAEPARIHLITNGVDTTTFTPGSRSKSILSRHALHGKKVLLTVARLEERKGHDTVIRALPQVLASVPEAVYLIVGQGAQLNNLQALVNKLGLSGRVIFAGVVSPDELPDFYRTCDLFVMPNRTLPNGDTEGFGLVFLEAAACEKPVIGGLAGGVPDAVINGETGILVDGTSVNATAAAVIRLLRDQPLAEHMSKAGLEHSRKHDWACKAQQLRQICATAAGLA